MAQDQRYREAENRIEEARQTGISELRLNSMGLTELPASLGELVQLQTLDLSKNRITKLPRTLPFNNNPMHNPSITMIIINSKMLRTTVIPDSQSVRLPM